LDKADNVTITFEYQKRELRNDPITQARTNHPILCPVKAAATVIKRLRSFGATRDTEIYTYVDKKGKFCRLQNTISIKYLRAFIKNIPKWYGIQEKEVGNHTWRSSSAMAMYLNEVPVFTIMLMGRWSSDAFLLYIRTSVVQFSNDVATRMIRNQTFHHIRAADREDPGTHNLQSAAANSGMGTHGRALSSFSIWG
jgi:hypothetical protein